MSSAVRAGGRSGGRTVPHRVPYAFLTPVIVLFLLTMLLPIGYTVYLSLRRVRVRGLGLGGGPRREVFAGLANYRAALRDPELWRGAVRVLAYGAILVPVMLGLALLFALLLDAPRVRFGRFSRLAIFLPYSVPAVIGSLLWGFLYLPTTSPAREPLARLGLPVPDVLGSTSIYLAVANIALWGGVGFNMIVILTALRAVPAEIYESARLDGCTETQLALRVKVPMVTPALIMTTIFSSIATLQVFTEPTTLRPLTNSLSSTWTPLMNIYQDAFTRGDIYGAAASSVLLAALTVLFSFGLLRLVGPRAFGQEQ
jgi:multiple sugar transport system permease protein